MSLKDQLLKAGLVTEKQAKEATHRKRQQDKKAGHKERQAKKAAVAEEARAQAESKRAADREAEAQRRESKAAEEGQRTERQRRQASIAAAYKEGRVDKWEGQRRYYYANQGRVEMLQVTDEAGRKLEAGDWAIVRGENSPNRHTLLNAGGAGKMHEVAPERVLVWHGHDASS